MHFAAICSNSTAGPASSITLTSTLPILPVGSAILLVVKGKLPNGQNPNLKINFSASSGYSVAPSALNANIFGQIYQAGQSLGGGASVFVARAMMRSSFPTPATWVAQFPAGVTLTAATDDGSTVEDFVISLYGIAADAGAVSGPSVAPSGAAGVGTWWHNSSDDPTTTMQVAMVGASGLTGMALMIVAHLDGAISLTDATGFTTELNDSGLVIQDDYFSFGFTQATISETFGASDVYVVIGQTLMDDGAGQPVGAGGPVGSVGLPYGSAVTICANLGVGASPYLGTGADGDLHFDGSHAVAGCTLAGGVYSMTRNLNATHIAIDLGVWVKTCNYIWFCTGTVEGPGGFDNSGGDGGAGSGDAFTNQGGTVGQDSTAGDGTVKRLVINTSGSGRAGQGGTGAVNGGGAGGSSSSVLGGSRGGAGGDSDGFVGGGTGLSGLPPVYLYPTDIPQLVSDAYSSPSALNIFTVSSLAVGGSGGGGGASAASIGGHNNGGGGGGRGGYGGWLIGFAKHFAANLLLRARGGNGGAGANGLNATGIGGKAGGGGGGGGGHSGGGGMVLAVTEDDSACLLTPDVSAGVPGSFGIGGSSFGPLSFPGFQGFPGVRAQDGISYLVSTGISSVSPVTVTFSLGSVAGTTTDNKALLLMPAFNAGDRRAQKRFGDLFLEAQVPIGSLLNVALWSSQYQTLVTGYSPSVLTPANGGLRAPYIVDFGGSAGYYAVDLEAAISWELGADTSLVTWQPAVIEQPETILSRPTDWDSAGTPQNKFVQGLMLEFDSFGVAKTFGVQRSDDLSIFVPVECPATSLGQRTQSFTLSPPILAHDLRIISGDDIPWRVYSLKWLFQPYPEQSVFWNTEMLSFGNGWQSIYYVNLPHISTADITLTLTFDQGPVSTVTLTVPNSGGNFIKTLVPIGANKFKLVSFTATSTAKATIFREQLEVWVKPWGSAGPFTPVRPFGGASNEGAEV